jgi:transposase
MESEQRQVAKKQMMWLMQEGYPWQEAASRAGIRISRSTAYRWFQQFRT